MLPHFETNIISLFQCISF